MRTNIAEMILGIISTQLDEANEKGYEEYQETLDDVEFEEYNWNRMAMEEMIDCMQYLMKENLGLRMVNGFGLNYYQKLSIKTMPKRTEFAFIDPKEQWINMDKSNYALGLCGEAGELGDLVKKNVHHGHEFKRTEFVKEAGDVLHYLAGICTMYDVTLEEVATMNLHKLNKRYSNGFSKEASEKRVDLNEK